MSEARRKRRLAVKQADALLAKRPCEGCTACCTAMGVDELSKPPGEACKHALAKGCAVYPARPGGCREFNCMWRFGLLDPEDRPDKSGVVFDLTDANSADALDRMLVARPAWPGAFEKAQGVFDRLTAVGHCIILADLEGPRRLIGPPDRMADLQNVELVELQGKADRCTDDT